MPDVPGWQLALVTVLVVAAVVLVGDAGGMVNPFNGEGIDYALEAGRLAAEVIVSARTRADDASRERVLAAAEQLRYAGPDPRGRSLRQGRSGIIAVVMEDRVLAAFRDPVRIAVLGDSFIEGDILTADLREKLQQAYGGGGAGFAPMASPLTAFRRTIKTQSKGWTAYNIMQRKAAPQNLRGHFFVSGWVCQPSEGASTRWENTDYRQRLDSCTAARVFFISPGDSRIELTLNDSLRREFEVEGAAAVRQVTVTAPHIRSLAFKVNSGTEGFIGYGAVFEADGVVVDNYSVRSNNGQAMFWTNPSVNAQINAHAGYDLVILQYGLNIMQTGVHNYTNYARQIEKMVVYVQQCFPTAAVLVLGVSDRSVKTDAGFEPMDAIPYMLDYQRGAAENTGAAFWPTCDAMRSLGGMEQFVANGWAGKDYTHINYAGGRRVAWSLVDAINAGAYEAHAAAEAARIRRQAEQAVLDSVRLLKIDRELRPVSAIGNLNTPRK